MDKYYYIISQLPTLHFGKEPLLSDASFMAGVEKWLPSTPFTVLKRLDFSDTDYRSGDTALVRDYKSFEHDLRRDLAEYRAARKAGKSCSPRTCDVELVSQGTPLEIEINLLKLRWGFLCDRDIGHHFDFDVLAGYRLKLLILEYLARFDTEKGWQKFKQHVGVKL